MKTNWRFFIVITFVFSLNGFGQNTNPTLAVASNDNPTSGYVNILKDDRIIVAYYVEETINMTFGKRVTKYEVSKLNMVYTNDLGPNNTRVVIPIYRKEKVKPTELNLQSKTIVEDVATTIEPIKVEVIAPAASPKYLNIDVVSTYAKVLDKGYRTEEMLTKVADRAYFDGDLATAAKYYEELFAMKANLDPMYYYRYAQSLKGINQTQKAEEAMLLFESKNIGNNVMKHNKVVRN
ncbi:hypothetical protein KHA90_04730 [Flavobacterium psychroterrae]|uniref:Tetratricopeptide repeat protein n=1 Tax=Flavobacterium psychroterrae TaxID=2133767 RepID=A0ABS5P7S4_9FLAO|nr:hypothetical protein [Flavobacterium psychroterrae]MBS7230321.1 hypothetical protein [Flavobacterium psychroterrae]